LSTNAIIYIAICIIFIVLSFIFDRKKTFMGIKKGWNMFKNILVPFINILIIVSIVLYLIPASFINQYLGSEAGLFGITLAAIIGSITLIPGFISYPIAQGLLENGASYTIVATLMTTLMMVGIVTLPLEIKYFGKNVAITRNALNFVAAIIIGLAVGVIL
jgi:uncharacterized membrane protein YraQ (UPF0718 family)